MDRKYILRIVKGEGTPEERARFFARTSQDENLAREYARVKNKYIMSTLPYSPSSAVSLTGEKQKGRFVSSLIKVAAVLFIPLMSYFIYDISKDRGASKDIFKTVASTETGTGVHYWVNTGVKATVILPDSTQVWLNSASSLDIPENFGKDNRLVFLSGEGFFKVKSNKALPFHIKTPKGIAVRVTGTEFNLSCYENDKNLKLTLLKGSLDIIREQNNEIISVKPNEQVVIDYELPDKKVDSDTDLKYATAWKEGNLRFEKTPMDEVVRKLERWYGVHITIENKDLLRHFFTADFESESIIQVMELMKITIGASFEIKGNDIRLY
ncbi:MAG: DUF4974 domain-containing protein [Bacteroidales bacterium]|nr:DUF4974 domain-containing protein [Bacteroidales bacterium]MDD2425751.1 DUF4974 domain-containing protein [Bacteroidales bacterium]MDD3989531.1 DUF4974 domain-containing protein [Bacteroidales bacterium]